MTLEGQRPTQITQENPIPSFLSPDQPHQEPGILGKIESFIAHKEAWCTDFENPEMGSELVETVVQYSEEGEQPLVVVARNEIHTNDESELFRVQVMSESEPIRLFNGGRVEGGDSEVVYKILNDLEHGSNEGHFKVVWRGKNLPD